jgi:hypothetical protein
MGVRVAGPLLLLAIGETWLIWQTFKGISGAGALGLLLIGAVVLGGYILCLVAFAVGCGRQRAAEPIRFWRATGTIASLVVLVHLVCIGFSLPAHQVGFVLAYLGSIGGSWALGRLRLVRA